MDRVAQLGVPLQPQLPGSTTRAPTGSPAGSDRAERQTGRRPPARRRPRCGRSPSTTSWARSAVAKSGWGPGTPEADRLHEAGVLVGRAAVVALGHRAEQLAALERALLARARPGDRTRSRRARA